MMDAPALTAVADAELYKPSLWITRPATDQRAERAASGGWPESEITALAESIARATANSHQARVVMFKDLYHIDFTDLPEIQPLFECAGLAGPVGTSQAH